MFYITLGIGCATIGIVYLLMTKKKKQSFKLTVVIVGASSGIGEGDHHLMNIQLDLI